MKGIYEDEIEQLAIEILREQAIGASIREAEFAQSKPDFVNKISISLKEANETDYWLSLLKDTEFITPDQHESLAGNCKELIAMLAASVKTAKSNKST